MPRFLRKMKSCLHLSPLQLGKLAAAEATQAWTGDATYRQLNIVVPGGFPCWQGCCNGFHVHSFHSAVDGDIFVIVQWRLAKATVVFILIWLYLWQTFIMPLCCTKEKVATVSSLLQMGSVDTTKAYFKRSFTGGLSPLGACCCGRRGSPKLAALRICKERTRGRITKV